MKVLVTGAGGTIGSGIVTRLRAGGHQVVKLVRREAAAADETRWEPETGAVTPAALDGADALIHLAGENIGVRWTPALKQAIYDSRIGPTRRLAATVAAHTGGPRTILCASAIGYYGDRGDELLTEDSGPGAMYLSKVCTDWEAALDPAREAGLRAVPLRFGMVLEPVVKRMKVPFQMGFGGPVGSGRQWWSWVALADAAAAAEFVLQHPEIDAAVNVTAPDPATSADFAHKFGHVLHRPAFAPLPAFAARLMLGEMADELLLPSQRVLPARLEAAGFRFAQPELEPALRQALGD